MINLKARLEDMGYTHLRYVDGVGWCGIHPMAFTVGVMLDLDQSCINQGRFCFSEHCEAVHFLENWDGVQDPTPGKDGCTANKRVKPL